MQLTVGQVASMELVLRAVTPYLLPAALAALPVVRLVRLLPGIQEPRRSVLARTILVLVISYFALNT